VNDTETFRENTIQTFYRQDALPVIQLTVFSTMSTQSTDRTFHWTTSVLDASTDFLERAICHMLVYHIQLANCACCISLILCCWLIWLC